MSKNIYCVCVWVRIRACTTLHLGRLKTAHTSRKMEKSNACFTQAVVNLPHKEGYFYPYSGYVYLNPNSAKKWELFWDIIDIM